MRVACLLVADLPLRAELRAHPDLAGQPWIVASGPDARAQAVAVSPEGAHRGVRVPCSLTHARAVCPDLRVRVASPSAERTARAALLDVARSFSPRAALAPEAAGLFAAEAAACLDARGVSGLFRSEEGFAAALGARAASFGLPGVVTIASSRSIARLAARSLCTRSAAEEVRVLSPESEAEFLAPLPLDLLDPDDALARNLSRFGVRTVRDLLRLPRRALAHRLGPAVLQLMARARGEELEPPLPEARDARLEEALDLEHPVDRLEPLLFVLRGLLSRLMERMEIRALACGPFELRLHTEGGGRTVRRVGVSAPTREVPVLLRLAALALESQPPSAPVRSLGVSARGHPARHDQLDLFRPRGPDPSRLDRTLAELEALCGPGRVGAPRLADDHRPGHFAVDPFRPGTASPCRTTRRTPGGTAAGSADGAALAARALRPPVAAEVRVEQGSPGWLRSAVAVGEILRSAGPWRTTGGWWTETERFAVDHFDVQVSDGSVLRLCFDWTTRAWSVDAIYD